MIYRIQITLAGKRFAGVGFFQDTDEAIEQTWADFPKASSISAICLRSGGAR